MWSGRWDSNPRPSAWEAFYASAVLQKWELTEELSRYRLVLSAAGQRAIGAPVQGPRWQKTT